MNVFCQDHQIVGESSSTLFSMVQATTQALITLQNTGANTINYRFQELVGSTWTDMDVQGTDLYNTLTAGQSRQLVLVSSESKVQLIGNASGSSTLDFTITRQLARSSGGALPLLNY